MATKPIYTNLDGLKVGILKDWRTNPLSTADRLNLGVTLNTDNEGLLVFDTDEDVPYYWNGVIWIMVAGSTSAGLPVGGTAGQVLAKIDGVDYNTEWVDQAVGGSGVDTMLPVGNTPNDDGATISGTTLQLQPADGTHPGLLTNVYQEIRGQKDFGDDVTLFNGANLQVQGAIQAYGDAGIQFDNYGGTGDRPPLFTNSSYFRGNFDEARPEYGQFGNGWKLVAFLDDIPAPDGGVTTMVTVGSSPNANGASISGSTLTLQPANDLFSGLLTAGTQNIGGQKIFFDYPILLSAGGILFAGGGGDTASRPTLFSSSVFLRRNTDLAHMEAGSNNWGGWKSLAWIDDIHNIPVAGTTNQALTKINATDYNTQWSTIDKTFVGLGNVDNTSDATKLAAAVAAIPTLYSANGSIPGLRTVTLGGTLFFSGQQVQATKFFAKAAGSSASVFPIEVQISGNTNPAFRVDEVGTINFGSSTNNILHSSLLRFAGAATTIQIANAGATTGVLFNFSHNGASPASSFVAAVGVNSTFNPSSGNAWYAHFYAGSTINQTGGANGAVYGFLFNPTVTAAADLQAFVAGRGRSIFKSIETAFAAKTTTYAVTYEDYTITLDATAGNFNATLPTAVGCPGRIYVFKRIDASANLPTINTTSSQTIDGATTYVGLSAQWKQVTVQSTGANWITIGGDIPTSGTRALRPAGGNIGQTYYQTDELIGNYIWDGTLWEYQLDTKTVISEDFLAWTNGQNSLVSAASGTGASGIGWGHPGYAPYSGTLCKCTTGTTTTGRASIGTNINHYFNTGQVLVAHYDWPILQQISDATDTYTAYVNQGNIGTVSSGFYFRYTHSVNGGKWQAVTINSGVETTTDTGLAGSTVPATMTLVYTVGTNVKFYVNGVLVATHTTNLPANGSLYLHGVGIVKSAGTGDRFIACDKFTIKYYR